MSISIELLLKEAKSHAAKGQLQEAFNQYEQLIPLCKQQAEFTCLLTVYKDICGVLVMMGKTQRVIDYSDEYLSYCEKYGSDADYLNYYSLLSTVKVQLQLYDEAYLALDQLAELAKSLNNQPYYLMAIANKLHIYVASDPIEAGYRHYLKHEQTFQSMNIQGSRFAFFTFKLNALAILCALEYYEEMAQPLQWLIDVSLEGFSRDEVYFLFYKAIYELNYLHDMQAFETLREIIDRAHNILDATAYGKLLETVLKITEKWNRDQDTLYYTSKLASTYKALFQKNQSDKVAEANAKLQVHESIRLAYIDSLTQCYNRRYLKEQQQYFLQSPYHHKYCFVLDIDHFKQVNDTYGHAFGDKAIQRVAQTLKAVFANAEAQIIRYGGDEFIVWLSSDELMEQHFQEVYERLNPIVVSDDHITNHCTISVGIAKWDGDQSFTKLFEHADQALYEAKKAGRSRYVLHA